MNNIRLILTAFFLCVAGCGRQSEPPPLEGAAIGGPFTLTGENGKSVKNSDFDGKYRLIYFGYTFCPDVCPTDVQMLMKGYKLFEKKDPGRAANLVPIFITVDPARDTPDVLKTWTDQFDPHLIGLTGTVVQIDAAARAFGVVVQRGEPDADGAYLVNHTNAAYLMGPKDEPIALISQDKNPQAVADELDRWVR